MVATAEELEPAWFSDGTEGENASRVDDSEEDKRMGADLSSGIGTLVGGLAGLEQFHLAV